MSLTLLSRDGALFFFTWGWLLEKYLCVCHPVLLQPDYFPVAIKREMGHLFKIFSRDCEWHLLCRSPYIKPGLRARPEGPTGTVEGRVTFFPVMAGTQWLSRPGWISWEMASAGNLGVPSSNSGGSGNHKKKSRKCPARSFET